MLTFPNAKINLGLNITRRRPDGYHDLETVFYPIPLQDALEVTPLSSAGKQKYVLHLHGDEVAGQPEDNLVVKAYQMLDQDFNLPSVCIHLFKHIPSGAGLGGGSADAAFMLKMLNELFGIGLSMEQLEEYAARLGADCAFFIRNKPVYAEGIGNLFTPVSLSLEGYKLWVVKPDVFVSTRDAFAQVHPRPAQVSPKKNVSLPVAAWRHCLTNDFEESVFPRFPRIAEIKDELYQKGALYASMSGSGSSVYGLFSGDYEWPACDFGDGALNYRLQLSACR
ncbi:MAG: 4-(cytidine 5'-diphospho)-2-C-methyl-D-erythritol kinase [Candidatus Bacteroides intestinipullorum]|uniref:4-diphosphocytidyl-2-C-methyl-D-erythritol kinase n=1 Tax=Candidatus Bacteroides intestinipullorum TaxID=2838471 RepID=A0A9E2KHR6_9BACE|nr:4-(cytidine 5'-diphospho)-2-C-methyl-D-erythritol kinase [Candidatus Bacteroides intestinipullorum]